ncbi:MAG TPA: DUF58 domain-containing protein [Streptosporangiaceae bacterium]|jgi:uncharacterized protein (DUF58 family)
MHSLLAGFTTRGKSFLAAGLAAVLCGLVLGEPALVRVGALVFLLPLLSALAAGRTRYRLSCVRQISPPRVPAGQPVRVLLRIENVSRLPTGLLLAEDEVPYTLGSRPRFVLERIERGGTRELDYPLRSDVRGKFTVGPLRLRVADVFGLVELGRSFSSSSTLVVSPKIVPLPGGAVTGSWLGEGDGHAKAAAAGEDDAGTRPYRDGDELRRVHWRSTARYGELMVRREEQQWRNHAVLLLDARRSAHVGNGATSSFEFAVSAAASIGVQLAMHGFDGQLVTDSGAAAGPGGFEDVMLDSLAVIKPSARRDLTRALAAVRPRASGLLVVVAGRLTAAEATSLVTSHPGGTPALALLLAVSAWAPGQQATGDEETEKAAAVLTAAGWRVSIVRPDTPLAAAWRRLQGTPAAAGTAGARAAAPVPAAPDGAPPGTAGAVDEPLEAR